MSEEPKELTTSAPVTFTTQSDMISLQAVNDELSNISSMIVNFSIKITPQSDKCMEKFNRVLRFLRNIHGGYVIPTNSEYTPYFTNGTFKNLSIEIPMASFTLQEILVFIYYKVDALLEQTAIIEDFSITEHFPSNITLNINKEVLDNGNPYLHEKEWVQEINTIADDEDNVMELEPSDEYYIDSPWWRRVDGQTRDLFNHVPTDEVVYAFTANIGDEHELEYTFVPETDEDPNDDNPENNDGPTVVNI